jgi:hypothetical protein
LVGAALRALATRQAIDPQCVTSFGYRAESRTVKLMLDPLQPIGSGRYRRALRTQHPI